MGSESGTKYVWQKRAFEMVFFTRDPKFELLALITSKAEAAVAEVQRKTYHFTRRPKMVINGDTH
jgi:hypothetical protein